MFTPGDAGKAASVPQINHKLAVVPESSVGEAELEADVTGNETEHSAVQPSGGAEPQDEGDPFEDGSDSDDSDAACRSKLSGENETQSGDVLGSTVLYPPSRHIQGGRSN